MRDFIFGLIMPMMALVLSSTFALLWWRGGMGRHVLGFALSYAMLAAGFVIIHFDLLPDLWSFHVTQAIFSLAGAILIVSLAERVGVRASRLALAVPYCITALGLAILVAGSAYAGPRLVMTNIGYGDMDAFLEEMKAEYAEGAEALGIGG